MQVDSPGAAETQPITVTDAPPSGTELTAPPSGSGWDCSASVVDPISQTFVASCTYTPPADGLALGMTLPGHHRTGPNHRSQRGRHPVQHRHDGKFRRGSSHMASDAIEPSPPSPPPSRSTRRPTRPASDAAGTPVTYTYVVTNTGNVTLDPVTVTDPMTGLSSSIDCPATLLGPAGLRDPPRHLHHDGGRRATPARSTTPGRRRAPPPGEQDPSPVSATSPRSRIPATQTPQLSADQEFGRHHQLQ